MTAENRLPSEYLPFEELIVCGNSFINGQVILKAHGSIALLVGWGEHPSVWLSVPFSRETQDLAPLVENNRSYFDRFTIVYPKDATIVSLGETVLLHAEKLSDQRAEVAELDLRPVGINVHGDRSGLHVGTTLLVENTFVDVTTMIAIASG